MNRMATGLSVLSRGGREQQEKPGYKQHQRAEHHQTVADAPGLGHKFVSAAPHRFFSCSYCDDARLG